MQIIKIGVVIAGFSIAAIQLGCAERWFCLPLTICGLGIMIWGLQL